MVEKVWEVTVEEDVASATYFDSVDAVGVSTEERYYVFSADSGRELLSIDTGTTIHSAEECPEDDTLLISSSGRTIGIDTERWQTKWASEGGKVKAISDDMIALAEDGTITCVDRASGQHKWSESLNFDSIYVHTMSETVVVSPDAGDDNTLVGLDVENGQQRWERFEAYWNRVRGYDDGILIQCRGHPEGSGSASLTNLNPVNGYEQWHIDEVLRFLTGERIGDLFICNPSRLVAVDIKSGRIAWAKDNFRIDWLC